MRLGILILLCLGMLAQNDITLEISSCMNSDTRYVNTVASRDIRLQWYHTGYLTQGHRISPNMELVSNTKTNGIGIT